MGMGITAAGIATATPHGHFMDFMGMHLSATPTMHHMDVTPITAMGTIAMVMEIGGAITTGGGQMEMVIRMTLQIMIIA